MEDFPEHPSPFESYDERFATYRSSISAYKRHKNRRFDEELWKMVLLDQGLMRSRESAMGVSDRIAFDGNERPWAVHPAMYAIVPVSLMNEDRGNVLNTLDMLSRETEYLDGPLDVLIWANMDVPVNIGPDIHEGLNKHYRDNGIKIALTDYVSIQYLRTMSEESDILAETLAKHI